MIIYSKAGCLVYNKFILWKKLENKKIDLKFCKEIILSWGSAGFNITANMYDKLPNLFNLRSLIKKVI